MFAYFGVDIRPHISTDFCIYVTNMECKLIYISFISYITRKLTLQMLAWDAIPGRLWAILDHSIAHSSRRSEEVHIIRRLTIQPYSINKKDTPPNNNTQRCQNFSVQPADVPRSRPKLTSVR